MSYQPPPYGGLAQAGFVPGVAGLVWMVVAGLLFCGGVLTPQTTSTSP